MQTDIPKKVDAIYARQSIDKADSISVESQVEFCKYESRGGAYQVFIDKGYSGKNTERPEFQRMLSQLRQGKISRVICYKLDRCSRSILDFTSLIEEFQKYGVEFVSCTEKFDTSTPMGRAMLNICIVFAQLERETIQQRVQDAYHSRSKKGFYMGGRVPLGFRLEPCILDGKRTSRYAIDEQEAKTIHFLYESYGKPDTSLADVVQDLQNAGIPHPRRKDGSWVRSHIGRMLANPIYVKADMEIYRYYKNKGVRICNDPSDFAGIHGCYLYSDDQGDGQCLVLAPHQGLVSSEIWLKCRNKQTNSRRNRADSKILNSWLTGKLTCAKCGRGLVVSKTTKKSGRSYRYILCPNAQGADAVCSGLHGWKAEDAERLTADILKKQLKNLMPSLAKTKPPLSWELDIRIAQIDREIEKSTEKALEAGDSLLPYLNRHIQDLEQQKAALLQKQRRRKVTKDPEQTQLLPNYDTIWDMLSQMDRRTVVDSMISRIYLSEESIRIHWRL